MTNYLELPFFAAAKKGTKNPPRKPTSIFSRITLPFNIRRKKLQFAPFVHSHALLRQKVNLNPYPLVFFVKHQFFYILNRCAAVA